MTPSPLAALLASPIFGVVARLLLTFIFWGAGLDKLMNYQATLAEMSFFGVEPAGLFAPAVIAVLLIGSVLVVLNRAAWLGFGMLAVFTALTIPIAHPFWAMDGEKRLFEFHVVVEHISLIGGLMVGAILCRKLELERRGREERLAQGQRSGADGVKARNV
ncbi:DoxX family protein [Xanthobacter autotrophicus]|uniref:DoxX family protein n=1 Tax=Xanthobacter autotrophicus TaxID=280 RepID=UPI0024A740ED|nr:DoxX family protein [Xanthobacter autotrophicus]MDI4656055.1 DoxX family protein [Xanthobacter autotrophicus]